MLGSITTGERCPICRSRMEDNGFTAVACPEHPDQIARKLRVRLKYGQKLTQKQFTCKRGEESYKFARRFLDGLRFKIEEGTYDYRDYRADAPLGFQNLMEQWLEIKRKELKHDSFRPLRRYADYAISAWGNQNVRTIKFNDVQRFLTLNLEHLSSKSRSNARSILHDFFSWLRDSGFITFEQIPKFPVVPNVVMAFRDLVDKDTQLEILDKLKEMTWDYNPRIWVCIKWLSTYFSIRPGEMLSLKEKHINTRARVIFVQPENDKNKQGKIIDLLPEDIALVESLTPGFPEQYFFRHIAEHRGPTHVKPGDRFHHNMIYRWWIRACAELGVHGVALYPGTKHSSVTALQEEFTSDDIKASSQISTNKAFMRYFRPNSALVKSIFTAARGDTRAPKKSVTQLRGDTKVTPTITRLKSPNQLPARF